MKKVYFYLGKYYDDVYNRDGYYIIKEIDGEEFYIIGDIVAFDPQDENVGVKPMDYYVEMLYISPKCILFDDVNRGIFVDPKDKCESYEDVLDKYREIKKENK